MKHKEPNICLEVNLVKDPNTGNYIPFEWKDVVGYEGIYKVSNYGHVKSLDRVVTRVQRDGVEIHQPLRGTLIKTSVDDVGYPSVTLHNKSRRSFRVHRLVIEAFKDNCNKLPCVNHRDGNKTNNLLINLEWSTKRDNSVHAVNNDLIKSGEQSHSSKLKEADVVEILKLLEEGLTHQIIADRFKVGRQNITAIATGRSWSRVTGIVYTKRGRNDC